jgi:hypothetical protein
MSELITDQTVKAIYVMLRKLPPFNQWGLPPASKIKFKAIENYKLMGEMNVKPFKMNIGTNHHDHFVTFVTTVAHEMIHLSLYLEGVPSYNTHGRKFKEKSHQVGSLYGFDRKAL